MARECAGGILAPLVLLVGGKLLSCEAHRPLCREVLSSRWDEWRDCRVQIGGLAIQGAAAFDAAFGPTFRDYLTQRLNSTHGLEFEVVPLNFNGNFEYVGRGLIDYIFSNPAAYTCMTVEFNVETIASLRNFRKGNALDQFAGVVFSRVGSNFSTVESLRSAHVAAVSISGLGAMQLQQAELMSIGLNIMTDVRRLTFTKNQNKIVQDVQNGWADVGFVRTDMIDRSVAANRTRWEYFQVINRIPDSTFPFARSTAFTPEWPIGSLPHVPPAISELVASELMRLDRHASDPVLSAPAIAGSFSTWLPPKNYMQLLAMLKDISYYEPSSRKCLRAADVLEAVNCPAGWVKQRQEQAFCPPEQCKEGYQCLCSPCAQLRDPELELQASVLPMSWNANIDATEVGRLTATAASCSRMLKCATVPRGQAMRWRLLDQIGDANREQINQYRIHSVEMLTELEGSWERMAVENVTLDDGQHTEQYVLNTTVGAVGTFVVQLRVNGEQAAMSPVVIDAFEPPQRRIFCPGGHKVEENGTCSACPKGMRADLVTSDRTSLLTPVCMACPLGSFQPLAGQSLCEACPVGGIAAVEGSTACTACPPGYSTGGNQAQASCVPCARGQEWSTVNGHANCAPCPQGRYQDREGEQACLSCSAGSFASLEGSVRCSPCSAGSTAGSEGQEACRSCARGSYTLGENRTGCQPCGQGMTTLDPGSDDLSLCQCPSGMFLRPGAGCVACEEGLECPGGNGPPLQMAGFWADILDVEARSYSVYKCRDDKLECPAGALGACARGRQGKACNNCEDNHHVSDMGECAQCQAFGFMPLLLACLSLVILIVGLASAVRIDVCQQSLNRLTIFAVIGQVAMAMQALSAIHELSIRWVEPVKSLLAVMQLITLDLDLLQFPCVFRKDDPILKLVFQLLAYPMVCCLIGFTWAAFKLSGKPISFDAIFNLNGILLFMLFIALTLAVLLPFQCASNPNGVSSVSSNPGITCWESAEHRVLAVLATVGTLCYPVAILSWAAWATIKYPARVQSGEGLRRVHRYRFFHQRFKVERYYYGLILLVRNAVVALMPVVLVAVPVVQVSAMGAVLLGGAALQSRLWPWRTETANSADMVSTFFLTVVLLCAASLLEVDVVANETLLGMLLCFLVVSSLASGLIAIGYSIHCSLRPAATFGAFLCHHKQGAGSLCRLLKIMMAKHCRAQVFLDSDHLERLDLLFETVRCRCKNLVVVLTPETLKQTWCAGEIVMAWRNNIPIMAVVCDGSAPLSEKDLDEAALSWTEEQKHLLGVHGITMAHVTDAYRYLLSLPPLTLSRFGTDAELEEFLLDLIQRCDLPRKRFVGRSHGTGQAQILVTGHVADPEALAVCQIAATTIQGNLQVETAVVRTPDEMEASVAHANYLVVVLTRGMLEHSTFARILLTVLDNAEHEAGKSLELVVVNSDIAFEFPTKSFYEELAVSGLDAEGLGAEAGPLLVEAYRSIFTVLAQPLTPHGSQGLIDEQMLQVCSRFHKLDQKHGVTALRRRGSGLNVEEVVARRSSTSGSEQLGVVCAGPSSGGENGIGVRSCNSKSVLAHIKRRISISRPGTTDVGVSRWSRTRAALRRNSVGSADLPSKRGAGSSDDETGKGAGLPQQPPAVGPVGTCWESLMHWVMVAMAAVGILWSPVA